MQPILLPVKKISLLYLLSIVSISVFAQSIDSSQSILIVKNKCKWRTATIAPAALISTGILATTDNDVIDRLEIHEERNEKIPKFRTHLDDYLQYAPIAAVYSLNALGIKGKNDFINRTALLIKSELIMTAIVFPLKKLTSVPRPDTGSPTSFPSGHTAQAFAAAAFLHKEYGKDHPLYSVLAYTTATGIGVLRVMNNRYWASDVLVGAGIGILATNLAYLTHKNITIRKNIKSALLVSPMYNQGSIGAYMLISLK